MESNSAIIIIDLQNEFFIKEGVMGENHFNFDIYKDKYELFIKYSNCDIYWIKSDYEGVTMELGYPTHDSNSCCHPGTTNHEFIDDVKPYITNVIKKKFYSCFHKTNLDEILKKNGIENLYFCGLTINNSVKHSVQHAMKLGFNSYVLEDLVITHRQYIYISPETKSFKELFDLGVVITSSNVLMNKWGEGDVKVVDIADDMFDLLKLNVKFHEMIIQGNAVPRLISIQSISQDVLKPLFRHPNDIEPPNEEMIPVVREIIKKVEELTGFSGYNHVLIQLYRDQRDNISSHSDKTLDMDLETPILNVSYGAYREMTITKKGFDIREKIPLKSGTAVVFGLETNKKWHHEIKKHSSNCGERISLTIRKINTFTTSDGQIIGQGSPFKTLDEIPLGHPYDSRTKLIDAFGEENKNPDFDWSKTYSGGFYVK